MSSYLRTPGHSLPCISLVFSFKKLEHSHEISRCFQGTATLMLSRSPSSNSLSLLLSSPLPSPPLPPVASSRSVISNHESLAVDNQAALLADVSMVRTYSCAVQPRPVRQVLSARTSGKITDLRPGIHSLAYNAPHAIRFHVRCWLPVASLNLCSTKTRYPLLLPCADLDEPASAVQRIRNGGDAQ